MKPPLLYFVHFQYAWWFSGTPLSLTRKILVLCRSHQAFNSSTNSLIVPSRRATILMLQCKKSRIWRPGPHVPTKVFGVSLHLFSSSARFGAHDCTCCIGSHSLVKYTRCRASCNFEHCIVVLWKITFLSILPEVSHVKIAVRSSWRKCTFWFLFFPLYFWNIICAFFLKESTSEAVSMW